MGKNANLVCRIVCTVFSLMPVISSGQPAGYIWEETVLDDFEQDFGWPLWDRFTQYYENDHYYKGVGYSWDRTRMHVTSGEYSLWCAKKNIGDFPALDPEKDNYPNDMDGWIIYREKLDLRDCLEAELVLDAWYAISDRDKFCIRSPEGTLPYWRYYFQGYSDGIEEIRVSLTSRETEACKGHEITLALQFESSKAGTAKGIFIDNIRLRRLVKAPDEQSVVIRSLSDKNPVIVDGDSVNVLQTFFWQPGSVHTVSVDSMIVVNGQVRYVFERWSDGGARSHEIIVSGDPDTLTASFYMEFPVRITVQGDTGGWVVPEDLIWVREGESIDVTAVPDLTNGYVFRQWTGDMESIENTQTVRVEGPVSLTAVFEKTTGVQASAIPVSFKLYQNTPNPFNPATTITFTLPADHHVNLTVYNMSGQKVGVLINEVKPAGVHSFVWDASNLGNGVYFYKFQAGNFVQMHKCILMK